MSDERPLELSVRDHVATVAFDRPERLNAVSTPLLEKLVEVFAEINDRPDVWCVILKGNGRAFCVGADQKERPGMSAEDVRRRRRIGPRAFSVMRECVRPVIAQVHGYALGSGLELAIGSDIVVAAEGTVFGMIETVLGAIPGGGATALLPRIVGPSRAKELIYTGRRFTAEDAFRWGMIGYVVPAAELEAKVMSLAREICAAAPIAVAQAKKAINLSADLDLASGMRLEAELYDRTIGTKDRAEALRAYAEKRPPVFRGE